MIRPMARVPRIIVPGVPHHVTQRGNRRQLTFFDDKDYRVYLKFLRSNSAVFDFKILSYCLMPNHIHLLLVPSSDSSLRDGIAQLHQSYTRYMNRKKNWSGHLWQGRFFSCPVGPESVARVARYIELNPVRAGLCVHPTAYLWSSAVASCCDPETREIFGHEGAWEDFLLNGVSSAEDLKFVRRTVQTGRPFGSDLFVAEIEKKLGRSFQLKKPGPKGKRAPIVGDALGLLKHDGNLN